MEPYIMAVDSQRINMIQLCAYRYMQSFNLNLVPWLKEEPLERGSLIHHMLEVYYTVRKYRDRWARNNFDTQKLIKVCERVAEYFATRMDLPIEEVDDTIRVFKEYVEFYQYEPHETIAVEQVGSKILYESEELVVIYETKIDWICTVGNVPLLPVDHKTSKRRGETIAISNQFMGYCWMLDVRNIMINKIGFQTTVKPKDKFQRPILSYPKAVLDNWVANTVYWAKILQKCEEEQVWPQNFTSCDKYSGCIFRAVCESEPLLHDTKRRELFEIRDAEWDVGAKL